MSKIHGMATPRFLHAAAAASLFFLVGCGGQTPTEVQRSLQAAANNIDYAHEGDGPCLGDAIFTHVGFDQLVAEGFTAESIALDEAGSVAAILDTHSSDELTDALTACLDINDRFRADLESQHLGDGITCDTTFDVDISLVSDFASATVMGDDTTIEIDDTPELRNLIRDCATEADFAAVFDLQTGGELARRIDESFGTFLREDGGPCAGPLVVEEVGFEKMNEIGVGVDGATFTIESLNLGEAEGDALVDAIGACTDHIERARERYRTAEPFFGSCVVEAIGVDDEWVRQSTENALEHVSSDRTVERIETSAINGCVEARILELFGENNSMTRLSARRFANDLVRGIEVDDPRLAEFGPTAAEYQCMAYHLYTELGSDGVDAAVFELMTVEPDSLEFWDASDKLWAPMDEGWLMCVGPWHVVASDLHRAGFSDKTLDCVKTDLGEYEVYADLLAMSTANMTDAEYWSYVYDLDTWYLTFIDAIEGCYSDTEQDLFDTYMRWIESYDDIEGTPVTEA